MTQAALAGWTPVALDLAGAAPAIDWGDLRGVRFVEPFLHQTIEHWAGGDPAPLVRTGLDALRALDDQPSLDPCAIIVHVSRCGSTLLSRLLGSSPGTLVVSEPAPVNALLLADPAALAPETQVETLRLLVRALGRCRFGDERRHVLKLSSWNVRRLALFRQAFPAAKLIWLQRAPAATVASLLADPPGWLGLRRQPARAAAIFGIAAPSPDEAIFCVEAVAALLAAAQAIEGEVLDLDHAELPDAAWCRAAPFIGAAPTQPDIARMREAARYDAKEAAPRLFAGSGRRPLPEAIAALVAERAEPLYQAISRRRLGSA